MSKDPLDSFVINEPETPTDVPSIKGESKTTPQADRTEPKVSDVDADTLKRTTAKRQEPSVGESTADIPADDIPDSHAENSTTSGEQGDIPAKPSRRRSRGSRFAIYLVLAVATGFILAIASNAMQQSLVQLRQMS